MTNLTNKDLKQNEQNDWVQLIIQGFINGCSEGRQQKWLQTIAPNFFVVSEISGDYIGIEFEKSKDRSIYKVFRAYADSNRLCMEVSQETYIKLHQKFLEKNESI